MSNRKQEAYKHDWSGSTMSDGSPIPCVTFSVGCFQWIPKSNGVSLKKGKAQVRVTGLCSNPQGVYLVADRICDELDAGTYTGPKTVRVGGA